MPAFEPAHAWLLQPCPRSALFNLHKVLIFIIFFNRKDFRFSPGYQSPYRILLTDSLGSFTWSLWPLAVFEFMALDEGVKVWGT